MTIRFLRVAQAEFDEAVAWYQTASPGLDLAFRIDVAAKLETVRAYPMSSPELVPGIRRASLRRFPYSLIFSIVEGGIVVIAVAHMRRRPRNWRARLSDPQASGAAGQT